MTAGQAFEIAVLGAGGHAKVVVSSLAAAGLRAIAVFDDDPGKIGLTILGAPVEGSLASYRRSGIPRAVIGIGANRTRKSVAETIRADWIPVLHPAAFVDDSASVASGTVVFAGAVVQPETRIGEHVIVNTACSIDHDCRVGSYAHIAPGAHLAGDVTIGEGALVGVGAAVAPGVRVGDWATVGAGAVVIDDVEAGATVGGVPARPLAGRCNG